MQTALNDTISSTNPLPPGWHDVTGNLPASPVESSFVWHGTAWVGTLQGIYAAAYGNSHWKRIGSNLPYTPVTSILLHVATQQIIAGTAGRGVWVGTLRQ